MNKILLAIRIAKLVYDLVKLIGTSGVHDTLKELKVICNDELCERELKDSAHKNGNGPI